jgi:hypothetical protein
LAFFVWFSNATVTSENQTVFDIQGNSSTRQQILFDEKIWCCKSGTTYLTGLDQCVPNYVSTLYNESFPNYSFEDATDGLTDCPDEYVSHSTGDFKLNNGTILVNGKRFINKMNSASTESKKKIIQHPLDILWLVIVFLILAVSRDAFGSVALPAWPWS